MTRFAAIVAALLFFVCSIGILSLAFVNHKLALMALVDTEKEILSQIARATSNTAAPSAQHTPELDSLNSTGSSHNAALPSSPPRENVSWGTFVEFRDKALDSNSLTFLLTLTTIMFATVGLYLFASMDAGSRAMVERVRQQDIDRNSDNFRMASVSSMLAQLLDLVSLARVGIYTNSRPSDYYPSLKDNARNLAMFARELRRQRLQIPQYQHMQIIDLQQELAKYADTLLLKQPPSKAIEDMRRHIQDAKVDIDAMRPT